MRTSSLVVLASATLALAACSGGSKPAPPKEPAAQAPGKAPAAAKPAAAPARVELLLWHSYRGEEKKALEALADRYNEAGRGATLKALAIPFDALNDKITAAVPRGHGPDLFIFAHNMIGPWADAGIVEPVGAWAEEKLLDRFVESTVKSLVYKGDLYGLPLAFKSVALYVNKGITTTLPRTLDELVTAAKAARDEKAGVYGIVYDALKLYTNAPWLHAFGASIVDDAGLPAFATPEAVRAVAFARSLMHEHKVLPEETSTHLATTLFNTGKAAYMVSGPWFLAEKAEGVDFTVTPLPSQDGRPAAPLMGSEAVMLSAKSKNKRPAFDAMEFLTDDASARLRWKTSRQTVANEAVYEDAEVKADAVTAAFRAQLDQSVPMSSSPRMQAIWSEADRALHRAIKGDVDPLEALTEASKRIKDDIARAGK